MRQMSANCAINNGRCRFYAEYPEVSVFADCLACELEERNTTRHSKEPGVDMCYRTIGNDAVQTACSTLSSWIDRQGTIDEFKGIVIRLRAALAQADYASGLCACPSRWKFPPKTKMLLANWYRKYSSENRI